MSILSNFFGGGGYQNPADDAMNYLDQVPGATNKYFSPFFNAGKNALPKLQGQYNTLLNNPGGKVNQIGQNFHESPGFQFALQRALQAAGHASAAGGMAGSPQHEEQNMGIATGLADQDYNNWMNHALGLYNTGLSGEQGFANMGQQAGQNMGDMISQLLAQKANLSYAGQQNENQNNQSMFNNILSGVGALSAFTPFKSVTNAISGLMGGGNRANNTSYIPSISGF